MVAAKSSLAVLPCAARPRGWGMWQVVGRPERAVLVWPFWEAPEVPSLEGEFVASADKKWGELMGFVCKGEFSCPQMTQPLLGNWNFIYFSFNVFKVKFWGKFCFLSSVKSAVLGRQAFLQPCP